MSVCTNEFHCTEFTHTYIILEDHSLNEHTCGGIICDTLTSNVCINNKCACGRTGKECSGATPFCLEPVNVAESIPATPSIGSLTAICQVLLLF